MRILITGASSLPGFRTVVEALKEGHFVLGLHKSNPIPIDHDRLMKKRLDVRDYDQLKSTFKDFKPDVVIHMAALGDVDLCEKDQHLAWNVNVLGTLNVARLASRYSEFLLYLSTDYVFNGEKGNYMEEDAPNPVNYYGLSKLMGEVVSMAVDKPYAIVRSSSIYGLGPGRKNFAKFIIENLRKRNQIKALIDQYTSPTEATLLSQAVMEIVGKKLTGIFHVVGERMNRYEFALKVAEVLGLDRSLISEGKMDEMKWCAHRPRDSSLNFERTAKILKTNFYSTKNALQILREEYNQGDLKQDF